MNTLRSHRRPNRAPAFAPIGHGFLDRRSIAVRVGMAVVVVATVAGAAIGAALGRSPQTRYRAEAVVVAHGPRASARALRIAAAMRVPQVIEAVSQASGSSESVVGRFSTETRPGGGLLIVKTRDVSPVRARSLADTLIVQTQMFLELLRTYRGEAARIGDFENDAGVWLRGPRLFAAGPRDIRVVEGGARFNHFSLEAICPAQAGCGPSVRLYFPFRAGVTYTATGWIRSDVDTTAMTMVLGSTAVDLSQMSPRRLRKQWRPYLVNWTPTVDHSWAELTFQTAERARARFRVDGVTLSDRRLENPPRQGGVVERFLFGARPDALALPAIFTTEIQSSTVRSTALGALVGLLFGLLALGVVVLASRS
jgi:hypothetical protein